jgi:uncharacterized protein YukE
MSVSGILDRIIARKKQATLSAAEQYYALVRSVANGSEVDCDHAATIIADAKKTAADFEKDVEVQQERIGLASQLRYRHELEKRLPKLEQAERIASENYQRVVSEAATKLNSAQRAKRDIEHELLQLTQIEGRLRESCLDASLLQRESELSSQRVELVQKKRPLTEDSERAKNMVQSHQSSVDALRIKIERAKNDQLARQSYQRDLPQVEQALRQIRDVYDQLTRAIAGIDSELSPIDQELESIRLKKLEV